ncbi:ABC transporter permease [Aquibacillus saliphilus]|uniref:ABC transporter permease n=1 Tax=Aquibacillus saliphilus TaxID=1909422 RepID=UPI001CEFEDAE|nr:ABC transporter permease [Aquibacillus saliphilus]
MLSYILKRLFKSIVVIFFISIVSFFAIRLAPGNPILTVLGTIGNSPEKVESLKQEMGLDQSLIIQYLDWIGGVLQGDLGQSLISNKPVIDIILARLPASVELILVSVVIGLLFAIPMGIMASARPGKLLDKSLSVFSVFGMSIPVFWLGLLMILLFSINLQWLPASGYIGWSEDPIQHMKLLVMPAISLGIFEAAVYFRFVRNGMLDILGEPYIETAYAKGLSPFKIYFKHGFRNTFLTLITVLGLEIGTLISGTVIVEQVFSWTGIGWLVLNSVITRDYTLLQGTILLVSVAVVAINFLLVLLYTVLDPRIKTDMTKGGS